MWRANSRLRDRTHSYMAPRTRARARRDRNSSVALLDLPADVLLHMGGMLRSRDFLQLLLVAPPRARRAAAARHCAVARGREQV